MAAVSAATAATVESHWAAAMADGAAKCQLVSRSSRLIDRHLQYGCCKIEMGNICKPNRSAYLVGGLREAQEEKLEIADTQWVSLLKWLFIRMD